MSLKLPHQIKSALKTVFRIRFILIWIRILGCKPVPIKTCNIFTGIDYLFLSYDDVGDWYDGTGGAGPVRLPGHLRTAEARWGRLQAGNAGKIQYLWRSKDLHDPSQFSHYATMIKLATTTTAGSAGHYKHISRNLTGLYRILIWPDIRPVNLQDNEYSQGQMKG